MEKRGEELSRRRRKLIGQYVRSEVGQQRLEEIQTQAGNTEGLESKIQYVSGLLKRNFRSRLQDVAD